MTSMIYSANHYYWQFWHRGNYTHSHTFAWFTLRQSRWSRHSQSRPDCLGYHDHLSPSASGFGLHLGGDESVFQYRHWAIKHSYDDLIEAIIPEATVLSFLDLELATCLERCHNWAWENNIFNTPDERNAALAHLLEWVTTSHDRYDEFACTYHAALFDCFAGEKHRLVT